MADKKKASSKPLNKKSMKKTKGGLLPYTPTAGQGDGSVRPDGRFAGKFAQPNDQNFNFNQNQGV